jgi:PAS domain S-box-containing protein
MPKASSHRTVLVVAGSQSLRHKLRQVLAANPALRLLEADNCSACLDLCRSEEVHCIILDDSVSGPETTELTSQLQAVGTHRQQVLALVAADRSAGATGSEPTGFWYSIKDPDEAYLNLLPQLVQNLLDQAQLVTETEQIREAARLSADRYEGIFNSTRNGVAIYQAVDDGNDFIFVDFNRAAEELEQIKREELLGKSVLEVFPGVRDFGLFDVFQRVWATGRAEHHPVSLYEDGRIAGWRDNFVYRLSTGVVVAVYSDETDRMRAGEALALSERKYRHLVDHAGQGILVAQDGLIRLVNHKLEEITGYPQDELLSRPFIEFIHPEDQAMVLERHQQRVDGEEPPSIYSFRVVSRSGKSRWVEINVIPFEWEGEPATLSFLNDISDRKRAELELETSADIVKTIPSGLFIYQFEPPDRLILLDGNPEAERLTGVEISKWRGKEFNEIWLEAREQGVTESFWGAMISGEKYETEDLYYRDQRLEGAFRVRVFPVPGDRLCVAFEVITERKRAEQGLVESEKRFRRLFEESNDAVFLSDFDGMIIDVNAAACDMLGHDRKALCRKTLSRLHVKEDFSLAEDALTDTLELGAVRYEARLERSDQEVIVADISAKVVDADSAVIQSIVRDITESRRLEAQLHQAQKMEAIGTLAGGIAHDFNNILTAITGNTELAKVMLADDDPVQERLNHVLTASDRASNLVKQILAFSRKTVSQKLPVSISPIIEETAQLLRATLPTTIEIKLSLDHQAGPLVADPTHIQQIVMNLCGNAAHAMREHGGELELELRQVELTRAESDLQASLQPGRHLKLTVRDTGEGMTPELRERIFEPYFTTKEAGAGTGMGLSVVHGIVVSMGGSVSVESEPGKGSAFHVYLPTAEEQINDDRESNDAPAPHGDERVLIVDDEEAITALQQRALEIHGYQVTPMSSGVAALELIRSQPDRFDLVITDQTMPKLTGSELIKEIIQIRPDLPIILCTGYSNQISEEKALEIGASRYIMKPFKMTDIARTVREVLDNHTSHTD